MSNAKNAVFWLKKVVGEIKISKRDIVRCF